MSYHLICQFLLLVTFFCFSTFEISVVAEEKEDSKEEYDIDDFPDKKLRFNFLKAKPGVEKGKAAHLIFHDRSPADINYLCYDKDDSIAFCAAWIRLKMQLDARLVGIDSGVNEIPVPQRLSREFIGFVEGRLKVPVPDAWARNVLAAKYNCQEVFTFEMKQLPYIQYQNKRRMSAPVVVFENIENDENINETVIFFLGGDSREKDVNIFAGESTRAKLPPKLKQALKGKRNVPEQIYATGIAGKGRAVIVLKDDGPILSKLMCMATDDSKEPPKLFWEISLDSYWMPGFRGTQWFTEFRVRNNMLYLFHCNNWSIGIECISIKDGSRIFSFNSKWPK